LIDAFKPIVEQQLAAARSCYEAAWARLNEVLVQEDGGYFPKDDVDAFRRATRERDSVWTKYPTGWNAKLSAISCIFSPRLMSSAIWTTRIPIPRIPPASST